MHHHICTIMFNIIITECPLHTQIFKQKDIFNWTATYRGDSTIVAPYERFSLMLNDDTDAWSL